ncbi:hypothetical protein [Jeotgalibacillus proteolyticus]|uniref:Lipoprotein n=1 Tax=Jeotgalibacillus proteolyticus TaxID=2082395 RepID=A0A2S5G6Z1_9BACL|nr:hypothetical protein [Jeotgalibacillus proteolyticus]PPA68691.1 hypothetical protein C4B60_19155 [Jeotgalibacillus proteolyticus]PPA68768.1 hypothetical protein C4B60_19585 [Jeotgalibacillus proteolyticus]
MKKLITLISFSVLLFVAAACGNDEINGQTPSDIPIEWANAMIQRDQATRAELLQNPSEALDLSEGPQNDEELQNYRLEEWKASDDKYFYEIKFTDPVSNEGRTQTMEIRRTDEGWKRTQLLNLKNFDTLVEGLDGTVLRELHEDD